MDACNLYLDPVDWELHQAGCCKCALYIPAPPQKRLSLEEAKHLLDLMHFTLRQLPNGLYVAVDEARGIQVPNGASIGTAHAEDDLAGLVVRAGCAHHLDGPMTIDEATKFLADMGFELKTRIHLVYGRQWWATSQRLATSTSEWLSLKNVVEAARACVAQERYKPARQIDYPEIVGMVLRDLDPKPWGRRQPEPLKRSTRRYQSPPLPLDELSVQTMMEMHLDESRTPDRPPR